MLKETIAQLPKSPGIYIMRDKHQEILYVGKAKRLKERVSSYFQKNNQHSKKTLRMIQNIASIDTQLVDTELDALLLECQLIQQYHPPYNRQMNFSKNYNYLTIENKQLLVTDSPHTESYGPYRTYKRTQELRDLLQHVLLAEDTSSLSQVLLLKQLPELAVWSPEKRLLVLREFLKGHTDEVLALLKRRQASMIQHLNFEGAQKAQEDILLAENCYSTTVALQQFIQQELLTFDVPDETGSQKQYIVAYGQLVYAGPPLSASKLRQLDKPAMPITITKENLDLLWILRRFYHLYSRLEKKKN